MRIVNIMILSRYLDTIYIFNQCVHRSFTCRFTLHRPLLTHTLTFSLTHTRARCISIDGLSHMLTLSPEVFFSHTCSLYHPHSLSQTSMTVFTNLCHKLSLSHADAHTISINHFSLHIPAYVSPALTLSLGLSRRHYLHLSS